MYYAYLIKNLQKNEIYIGSTKDLTGFTIIELLVSAAVIFLILGFAFAGYARFNQRQILISNSQSLKSFLRDAQNRAYSGEMDCSSCDCSVSVSESLSGWYIDFSIQKIYGECTTVGGGTTTFGEKSFNISNEIIITPYITPPVAPPKLLFNSSPPGVNGSATICLSSINLSDAFYSIQVTQTGEISDSGSIQSSCP